MRWWMLLPVRWRLMKLQLKLQSVQCWPPSPWSRAVAQWAQALRLWALVLLQQAVRAELLVQALVQVLVRQPALGRGAAKPQESGSDCPKPTHGVASGLSYL
jgi:hypothetical protein